MGWDDTVRQKRLAPIGEYRPEVYRVKVHDSFRQLELEMAALGIENGMSVPDFLFLARYVIRHHRRLKKTRMVVRMGLQEIWRAVREPIGPEFGSGVRTRSAPTLCHQAVPGVGMARVVPAGCADVKVATL